jgi:hypothetical protein
VVQKGKEIAMGKVKEGLGVLNSLKEKGLDKVKGLTDQFKNLKDKIPSLKKEE